MSMWVSDTHEPFQAPLVSRDNLYTASAGTDVMMQSTMSKRPTNQRRSSVGGNSRLILTLFAPYSHMDHVYKTIQLLNADICARVARNATAAGSDVGGYQDCAQPLDNDDFYDFLDQTFHAPTARNGQLNLCRASDWCRCIDDPGNRTCADPGGSGTESGSSGVTS